MGGAVLDGQCADDGGDDCGKELKYLGHVVPIYFYHKIKFLINNLIVRFSGAEKEPKRHSPNQGLPPREGCKRKVAETDDFSCLFGIAGRRDGCFLG